MIYFYAARHYVWTIADFIRDWAPTRAADIQPVGYDLLRLGEPVPPGLHLFTDFERLLRPEQAFVRRLGARLRAHPDSYQTVSDPARWCGRFGLLRALSERGLNDYRAYRADELDAVGAALRFPVFLRLEHEHTGSLGGPIHTMSDLRRQIREQTGANRRRRLLRRYLMIVEQLDMRGADGLYRKYSAMKIGNRLIPRHVFFSADQWVQKSPDIVNHDTVREETAFCEDFPHARQVDEVFRIAGLEYGRIDYGFRGGRMQVWEINTNPVIAPPPQRIAAARLPLQTASAMAMVDAFDALQPGAISGPAYKVFATPEQLAWQALAAGSRFYDRYRN